MCCNQSNQEVYNIHYSGASSGVASLVFTSYTPPKLTYRIHPDRGSLIVSCCPISYLPTQIDQKFLWNRYNFIMSYHVSRAVSSRFYYLHYFHVTVSPLSDLMRCVFDFSPLFFLHHHFDPIASSILIIICRRPNQKRRSFGGTSNDLVRLIPWHLSSLVCTKKPIGLWNRRITLKSI